MAGTPWPPRQVLDDALQAIDFLAQRDYLTGLADGHSFAPLPEEGEDQSRLLQPGLGPFAADLVIGPLRPGRVEVPGD
jgi:hypothetical protein